MCAMCWEISAALTSLKKSVGENSKMQSGLSVNKAHFWLSKKGGFLCKSGEREFLN